MNWDQIADVYTSIAEDRERILLPALTRVVRKNSARKVLDFGGGDGRFLELLSNQLPEDELAETALYEPAERMRELAKARLRTIPNTKIFAVPSELPDDTWDLVLFIAVWMCLRTEEECVKVLRNIRKTLRPNGLLLAAVTHPCFRDRSFNSYSTSFDMSHYFDSGVQYKVQLYDSVRSQAIIDTHWSLSDHARQLSKAGLLIKELMELPDTEPADGAPWLLLVAGLE